MDQNKREIMKLTSAIQEATRCGYVRANEIAEQAYDAGVMAAPKASPKPKPPRADLLPALASVALAFLEDWSAGRLTSDELCETLATAAQSRGLMQKHPKQEKTDALKENAPAR